jgi:hypothetical protein
MISYGMGAFTDVLIRNAYERKLKDFIRRRDNGLCLWYADGDWKPENHKCQCNNCLNIQEEQGK